MLNVIRNHVDYERIDDALNFKLPECLVELITSYNVVPKTEMLKELKKERMCPVRMPSYVAEKMRSALRTINQADENETKIRMTYDMFNYVLDNKTLILNKHDVFENILKTKLNNLYYDDKLINLTYYQKMLFGDEFEVTAEIKSHLFKVKEIQPIKM